MYVILVYDVSMERNGAKVLRNVFKICKKYLQHVQCSVFEGELSPPQIKQLEVELNQYLRDDIDSVILFQSRQEKWLTRTFLGEAEEDKQFL